MLFDSQFLDQFFSLTIKSIFRIGFRLGLGIGLSLELKIRFIYLEKIKI